jgi:hypothetical protein
MRKELLEALISDDSEAIQFEILRQVAENHGWELTKREGADDPDYVRPLATDEADAFITDLNDRLTEQRANGLLEWTQGRRP